ncbi:MBL fold metallo-hydrolase [Cyanobacterium sp. IPPAS B-1200]|uniref:MBL fold metallo-hydrolase n=1 Tax=Cyanobacterium sp. IPPAS B-1200 TaxID=1562720 RepID=UPI0008524C87|nr:MBL fold metallo-hydrolase [Cyanobacterium sp. IPPAS B-1200]OEJ77449.1 MBL fold metallo-hydrolase [Cyanobacterium sp. IPPAS B-1200]
MTPIHNSTEKNQQTAKISTPKAPKLILENIWAFPPNRDILGGTSYLITSTTGNILIDSPPWHPETIDFCNQQGGVKYLFITNRDGISKHIGKIKQEFDCQLISQEQEVYLLPHLDALSFGDEYELSPDCKLIWTSGYSPGSSCLYYQGNEGVLFTGRHLLPTKDGKVAPLKLKKTFHWRRQQLNAKTIMEKMQPLTYICPGASTGYLRGRGYVTV